MTRTRRAAFLLSMMAMSFLTVGHAADDQADKNAELAKLKAQLEQQQEQIEQLSKMLTEQRKVLEQVISSSAAPAAAGSPASTNADAAAVAPAPATPIHMLPNMGEVASSTPMLPPPPPAPAPHVLDPQVPAGEPSSPLQLKIGDATLTPVGFMDLTGVWRNENAGSGIGSSFGSVPLANAATAHLSEFRFSPQNSRFGFRFDANVKGAHIIGYNEMDFLGTSGSNSLGVTNGAFVPRIRLYWVDVRKGNVEFLAGQSWSLLTPGRKGISPLPGDLFYSQVMDVNYVAGLTWTRQPGLRLVYHPADTVAVAFATALASLVGGQLDNASTGAPLSTPNLTPDFIAKVAFDPISHVHFEVAGIERNFKDWNPSTNVTFTKSGAGGSFNGNFEVVKNFRLITNNYWSDGGGRYLFGQAPDVVIRSNGSLSPIHSGGMVHGFEANLSKNFLLFAYYGDIYVGKDVALDANGTSLVGYGFHGGSQNRNIQEFTIGYVQTFWKDAKYGALSMITQYEWLNRYLWYVAPNTPKGGHDSTVYVDIRYTLPGSAPTLGK
jgi:dsDNA-binding SOS-regulon protein